jgi:glycosyltransferase involved in cell wall biosynthesis
MELSVVIPAYNEERRLPGTLRAVLGYLSRHGTDWEVLVVDDGSTDATARVVRSFADPRLELIRWPVNRGKGHAVRVGVLASTGRRVLLSDADLAAPIEELPRLRAALDTSAGVGAGVGAGAAIGSRALAGSRLAVRQHPLRELCGRIGNGLIRGIAVPGIADTQCGFKLYDGEPARLVYRLARLDGWCSDAEVLHLFARLGFGVIEVPIRWSHQPGSKVRPSAYVAGLAELLRIRRYHRRLPALDVRAALTSGRL